MLGRMAYLPTLPCKSIYSWELGVKAKVYGLDFVDVAPKPLDPSLALIQVFNA